MAPPPDALERGLMPILTAIALLAIACAVCWRRMLLYGVVVVAFATACASGNRERPR